MLEKYIDSLQKESDRGCALIGTELLSDVLRAKLEKEMQGSKKLKKEILNGLGPLSTFSAKIKMSYCFKVISKPMYDELNHLRFIRNIAAHSIGKFSFENEDAKERLSLLNFFDHVMIQMEDGKIDKNLASDNIMEMMLSMKAKKMFTGRAKYNYTVALLYGMINN